MANDVRRLHPAVLALGALLIVVLPLFVVLLIGPQDEDRSDPSPEIPVIVSDDPVEKEPPHATFTADRPGETTGAISGRVIDRKGKPCRGARVAVSVLGKLRTTVTDEVGAFEFVSLPPGVYALDVVAEIGDGKTVRMDAGAPVRAEHTTRLTKPIDMRKARGWSMRRSPVKPDAPILPVGPLTLRGIVVDEHDRPIPEVLVRATQPFSSRRAISTQTTGPDGSFAMKGLVSNRPVHLKVSTEANGSCHVRFLRADRQDVVVRLGPVGIIEGHVVLDGKPVAAEIRAYGPGPDDEMSVKTDSRTGRFRLGPLPVGPWTLHATNDEEKARATHHVRVRANRAGELLEMTLDRGPDLEVFGRLLPSLDADGNETSVSGRSIFINGPVSCDTQTDEHGRFRVLGLVPGVYVAYARDAGPSSPFRVPRKREVVIGGGNTASAEVNIKVINALGEEMPGFEVLHLRSGDVFRRDAADVDIYPSIQVGRHGFVLPDPRRADPWSGPPTFIELEPGESREITMIDDVPRVSLRGRLRSPLPTGPCFAYVSLVPRSGLAAAPEMASAWCKVDLHGCFEIASLSLGHYLVTVTERQGGDCVTVGRVHFGEEGRITRDLNLSRNVVSGTVVEPGSRTPVPWARVLLFRLRGGRGPEDEFCADLAETTADEDGCFTIHHVPNGRHAVALIAPDRAAAFVAEVVVGGPEPSPLILEAHRGAIARIEVVREDGAPFDEGTLCIRDEKGRFIRFDQPFVWYSPAIPIDGPMCIRLRPGQYTLFAQAHHDHAPVEQSFRVTRSGAHVRVVIPAGAAARVRVVDAEGPVPNARIRVLRADGVPIPRAHGLEWLLGSGPDVGHRTSVTGRVLVGALPAGKLCFVAETGDGRRGEVVKHVEKASLFDVVLRLK